MTGKKRLFGLTAGLAAVALTATACGGSSGDNDSSGSTGKAGGTLTIGTTDKVYTVDPAGSYDQGSFVVMNQVFPFLLNSPLGSPDVEPDIAESASFTSPTEYTVKLKSGLKFANGHELTSSDVKFTFDRMVKINAENGPASLLFNLDSTTAPDPTTVVFKLKQPNDQTFPQVLSSPAGPIVDEEVFSPDKITPDKTIVDGQAFAGQYVIKKYDFNQLVSYEANPDYQGLLGPAKVKTVNVTYYANTANLKLDVGSGEVDVAYRSLSPTDIADLRKNDKVNVVDGPGGEIRYIVFNFKTQPFGTGSPDADPAKALAVRQAVADLIDREDLASNTYKDTYTPLYSFVPSGVTGAVEPLKSMYGDKKGGPSAAAAKKVLADAGVSMPVKLNLQYNPDHYGSTSADEYAKIKDQLERDGVFAVNLQSTEWVTYNTDRTKDVYPAYQLGWFPDYADADNYLTPFFLKDNFLHNHYDNAAVNDAILKQAATPDKAERTSMIEQIQEDVAKDLSTVPYLQGSQLVVASKSVQDVTLDASFKFRFASMSKS